MASPDEGGVRLTGEQFDRYLDWAEAMLASADRHRARLQSYRALLIGVGAVAALAVAALVVARQNPLAAAGRFVLVLAAAAAAGSAISKWLVSPTAHLYERDEDAVVGAITVLRDVAPHMIKNQRWDPDRAQVTMERLQRFPVGRRKLDGRT